MDLHAEGDIFMEGSFCLGLGCTYTQRDLFMGEVCVRFRMHLHTEGDT